MNLWNEITLSAKNYRGFGDPGVEIQRLKQFNIIVGRNNSGKSALLDMVQVFCGAKQLRFGDTFHLADTPRFYLTLKLPNHLIEGEFSRSAGRGHIGGNHWEVVGKNLVGKSVKAEFIPFENKLIFESIYGLENIVRDTRAQDAVKSGISNILEQINSPFIGIQFKRIAAERNIVPENDSEKLEIVPHGGGLTNAVQGVFNRSKHNRAIITRDMLNDINSILNPDVIVDDIIPRRNEDGRWEIFLKHPSEALVPLNNSGSGIKTVLMVVSFYRLIPYIENFAFDKYLFAFEELENNLHPALQRRLSNYIIKNSRSNAIPTIITSHSAAIIDSFSKESDAQLIHVTNDLDGCSADIANTFVEKHDILEDIGVRASDLLQSNCIIWLEGPSDKVYIRRWIELMSGGLLKEGVHYQCLFYGGRLLNHIFGGNPESDTENLIHVLRVNRRAFIVMDSDKASESDAINLTKQRIIREFADFGGHSWVTAGREIENYLTKDLLSIEYPSIIQPLGQYEKIQDYLAKNIDEQAARKFTSHKFSFAQDISKYITVESIESSYDLKCQIERIISVIRKWNGEPE